MVDLSLDRGLTELLKDWIVTLFTKCFSNSGLSNTFVVCLLLVHSLQAWYGCPRVYGAVQRTSYCTLLCVPSVLCWTVVFGQILVLFFIYTSHAGSIWVYFGTATTTEHGRNPKNGKQTTYFAGNMFAILLQFCIW